MRCCCTNLYKRALKITIIFPDLIHPLCRCHFSNTATGLCDFSLRQYNPIKALWLFIGRQFHLNLSELCAEFGNQSFYDTWRKLLKKTFATFLLQTFAKEMVSLAKLQTPNAKFYKFYKQKHFWKHHQILINIYSN